MQKITTASDERERGPGAPIDGAHQRPWEEAEAAFLAKSLTARPDATGGDIVDRVSTPDTATRLARARRMLQRLEHHTATLRTNLPSGHPRLADLMRAITEYDDDELARLGVDVTYAWLDDLLTALISGEPFVEIETVGPYAVHHIDGDGALDVSFDNLPDDERAGILLAAILRDALDGCANVRIVALLDDLHDDVHDRHLEVPERDRYVVQMTRILYERGVFRSDDVPGDDYVLLRMSADAHRVDQLVDRLEASGRGFLERTDDGDVTFWPSAALIDLLALSSSRREREFARRGIAIRRGGRPTCHAIDAAGFLDPVNRQLLHVVMLDSRLAAQQDKTYALLRAIDVVRQDTHHNVFFDTETLSPELVALVICQLLVNDLQRLIALLGRFDEWESFDADEFRERHYGHKILPEDGDIIDFVVDEMAALDPGPAATAIDVGAGPNLYPAMLIAPYVANEGSITLLDYASANLASLDNSLRTLGADQSPWARFETRMADRDQRYRGAANRLPSLCRVEEGSIYDLPADAYDIVTSFFVAESITTSRREFRVATRALRDAVRVGGVLVAAYMVGSTGYHAGVGTRFPAVRLFRQDLEEACRDADLDFAIRVVSHDEKGRTGYQGMAAIVARRLR